ncbi:DUF4375 domain-containing protein [Paenibacillus tritici]|uniref:DUF4375 domain-containing protein n=1 Tax=Paenibacillus tritici TaxID=1873425 RepID=A0ABX2DNS7_9BACL|nr:DUF4375 domain-containing protein [Paenibacillus tritici]NQX46269.1 DUF4375 domain-containing protein [Paenibacillus tritici]QUL52547.1 DUF4375 domain-containing protein [Paenibacillus tritici]
MIPVTMEREIFNSLVDERLGWACMEPTFMKIRAKSPAVKNEAIAQLGRGQRALCMFRILYGHSSKSAEEYYAWICYLLDQPGYWSSVLEGLQFFGDDKLVNLLEESKELFEARNQRTGADWGEAAITDLEKDAELLEAVNRLYSQYKELTTHSLQIIAGYIRSNPNEFIVFSDGQA